MLVGDKLIAARDPHGFRPLMLGRVLVHAGSFVVASESCAFDLIGAEKIRDIEPGEPLPPVKIDNLEAGVGGG